MSFGFRKDHQPITVKAIFRDAEGLLEHGDISWYATHPAVQVEPSGDTAQVGPADPSVATDAQVFAVLHRSDGTEQTSAPFGVQVGHEGTVGSIEVVDNPNALPETAAADGDTPAAVTPTVTEAATGEPVVEPAVTPPVASEPVNPSPVEEAPQAPYGQPAGDESGTY